MNYQKHYDALVSKAESRTLSKSIYTEMHHIIPSCVGGSDDSDNLVSLLPEEHLVAHLLLTKIYPSNAGLAHAAFLMVNGRNNTGFKYNNKKYGWVKRRRSKFLSEQMKKDNPFKGKKHTPETRKIMSEKAKNRTPWNKGKTGVQVPWNASKNKNNNESIKKMSENRKGSGNPMFGKTGKNNPTAVSLKLFNNNNQLIRTFETRKDLYNYCVKNGLPFNGLYKTIKTQALYHDGSKCKKYSAYDGFIVQKL